MPKVKPAPASRTGMIEGAHPTAPGGMTQANLRIELAEKHGVSMNESRSMTWPEQIEAVAQGRRARELEAKDAKPAAATVVVAPAEVSDDLIEGECKHGEDPDLCSDCEDELLGLDDLDDDEDDGPQDMVDDIVSENVEVEDDREWQAEQRAVKGYETGPLVVEAEDDEPEDEVAAWLADLDTERDGFEASLPAPLFIGMPGVLDYSFSGHAGTGPSGAERWMNCTASLGMSRRFLERLSQNQQTEFANASMAARQGTTAHAAAEVEARVMLGEMTETEAEHNLFELAINPPAGEEYTPEMEQFITEYTDLIKVYVDEGHEVLIEAKVLAAIPLTAPLPLETATGDDGEAIDYYVIPGSVDCGVMPTEEDPVLTAIDLKYGEGKDVDPDSNPQVRIYMLALLAKFVEDGGDIDALERLDYVIAQPRLGGIKSWTESVDDLLAWRDDVLSPALTAALGLIPSAFAPGDDTCQWCPARGGCPALANARTEAAAELFTALDDAEFADGPGVVPADLDDERLASLLKQITGLVDLQADLKAEAQRRMYRGDKVPGMVLVNFTPARSWKDEALEFFRDEDNQHLPAWKDPALVSPTAFVKAMASEFQGTAKEREAKAQAKFARFIEVPDKRPVVAFEGDRRSLWQDTPPDQMFPDDLTD